MFGSVYEMTYVEYLLPPNITPKKPSTAVATVSVITNHVGKLYVNKKIITVTNITDTEINPKIYLLTPETKEEINPALKEPNA